MDNLEKIKDLILSKKTFIITAHISPDPDAVGSSVALARGLISLGKSATVYLADSPSENLASLIQGVKVTQAVPEEMVDAVIIVDTATKKRVGKEVDTLFKQAKTTINIDHHISNDKWAEHNYVHANAAASAQIVFSLLKLLNAKIDPETANLLYAGLLDDTGRFSFSNTNELALQTAASLVSEGAQVAEVTNALYFSVPERILRLRAVALSEIKPICDGHVSFLSISNETLELCKATAEDCEGLIDEVRSVSGVVAAVLMRQIEEKKWKLSLRSKVDILNVQEVAAQFDGGGHVAAAGCTIFGTEKEVEAKITQAMNSAIDNFTKRHVN